LELLGRPEFVRLLNDAQETYDVVLIDTPAAHDCADSQVVAARVRNALIVAREDVSRLDDLEALIDRIAGSGARVLGAALNRY
jgi:Mrp family chromosome partitioning ATPase